MESVIKPRQGDKCQGCTRGTLWGAAFPICGEHLIGWLGCFSPVCIWKKKIRCGRDDGRRARWSSKELFKPHMRHSQFTKFLLLVHRKCFECHHTMLAWRGWTGWRQYSPVNVRDEESHTIKIHPVFQQRMRSLCLWRLELNVPTVSEGTTAERASQTNCPAVSHFFLSPLLLDV